MATPSFLLLCVVIVCARREMEDVPDVGEGTALTEADFQRGRTIGQAPIAAGNPPMYNPDLFEGDITGESIRTVQRGEHSGKQRNALKDRDWRWPNGRVPYQLSRDFGDQERAYIAAALEEIHNKTCVRFVPKDKMDGDYVYVIRSGGCSSDVGQKGGVQYLRLGSGCSIRGTIQHEFMHALGFFHEQSRADRNDYVTVYFDNIYPPNWANFRDYELDYIDHLGEEYDYGSVMHYAWNAFSKNGQATILPKDRFARIGQKNGVSKVDVRKINKLYECSDFLTTTTEPITTTEPLPQIVWPTFAPGECKDRWSWCLRSLDVGDCVSRDAPTLQGTLRDCPKACGLCEENGNTVEIPEVYRTGAPAAATTEATEAPTETTEATEASTEPEKECEDTRKWCANAAARNKCNGNTTRLCPKSCGKC